VQWHERDLGAARLTGKAAENRKTEKNEKAHRIGNHRYKDGT
jgi:hypothetical protein